MTSEQLSEIEARLRAQQSEQAAGYIAHAHRELSKNAPADIAALLAAYKDASRERDKVRMLFDSKDDSLIAIARERDEARAQLEAVTRERDRYKAALERIASEKYGEMIGINSTRDIAREALKGGGMTKLEADAYELAGAAAEHAWAKQGELDDDKLSDDIAKLAREFAAEVLRSIYDVSDNDQHSSDGARARGAYWVKREYAGDECTEKRHYRKDFESMIAVALKAAEGGQS